MVTNEMAKDADGVRGSLERQRLAAELRLKRAELELRRAELESRKNDAGLLKTYGNSPLLLAIIGGTITVLGGIGANYYQSQKTLELERQKQQHELIVKMISTEDLSQAARNLLFLVNARLITDADGQIAKLVQDPGTTPFLSIGSLTAASGGATLRQLPGAVADLTWMPYEDVPPALKRILEHSEVSLKPSLRGKALYDAFDAGQRARLVMLYAKMSRPALKGNHHLTDFIIGITDLGADRLWARIDPQLREEVQASPQFRPTSDLLQTAPAGFVKAGSYRTLDRPGSVQIVFYSALKGPQLLAEIDVD